MTRERWPSEIATLRDQGEVVVELLPAKPMRGAGCDRGWSRSARLDYGNHRRLKALNMAKNVIVVGTQWGDEGKGKIVDWLTDHAQGVVRFRGHNAGHTLVVGDGKVISSTWCLRASSATASPATSATAWYSTSTTCSAKSPNWKKAASTSVPASGESGLPPHPAPPFGAGPGPRGGQDRRPEDRHHRQGHRPHLRGQGVAPRPAGGTISSTPSALPRSSRKSSTTTISS